jgi:L-ascorbate metabolism protein UlaG (beta-lactamase superfamily)
VVTDPYSEEIGLGVPRLKGDIVTVSHQSPGHNNVEAVKGNAYVLVGPGEYEIGGVFVTGIPLHQIDGGTPRVNVAYLMDYDSLTVLHLGDLSHIPSQSVVEDMGQVNVLLVPVGGGNSLRAAQAAEVIALIEPHYVIPMHYALPGLTVELDPVEKFLKTMGVSKVQEDDFLRVSASGLPDQTQIVILRPQGMVGGEQS